MRSVYNVFFFFLPLLTVALLTYCFLPVLTYDTRLSQHVNHSLSESLAPGRILLTDRNGEIITDKMYPNGYYTHISTNGDSEFVRALIEIEDKNFYSHWGVNLPSKLRALRDNMSGKRVSGGSTITEQYVKNKYFRDAKRSYLQKAREAVVALYIDVRKDKDKILNIYYHDAYFGNQLYGVGAALEVYLQKDNLDDLTQEEIVILLSLLHNPGINSLEETYFQEYFEQVQTRLGYKFERTYTGKLPKKENIDKFPFVTQNYTERPVDTQMTIDARLQWYAREVLEQTLQELSDKNVTNGAIFAINPSTGETLIYQGSKDFYATDIDGQVDVVQSLRQPGSTMKPFLYLMALRQGANPDDLILDIESEYNSFKEGTVYISENYSLKEYGLVRFKKALGNSFNNAAVRLARELGLGEVFEFYKSYGFELPRTPEYYGYSLVLGNPSIRLEQLVRSYAKLLPQTPPPAHAGIHPRVSLSGAELNSPGPLDEGEQINASLIEEAVAKFLLYNILSDPDNRDVSFGVNSILSTSIPQAVKTGTSSDFRDNLVVSYHPDFVLGVWVGNNDNSSMQGVTGITGAGYIWHHVIEKAIELGYITDIDIPVPEGVELSQYCLDKNCYRKENIYTRKGKEFFSRPAEGLYRREDLFENLSEYELRRLEELSIDIK